MTKQRYLDTLLPLQPTLQLVAERLLGSETEAEDAVQDLFLSLWEKKNELKRVVNPEAYAMQTLKHQCISILRKRKTSESIDSLADISDDEAQQEATLFEERAAQLDRMMARLPEVQRQAIQMRYIDQLSHEEIQRRLHMSSSNVYTTVSRAMSALKAMKDGR